MFIIDLINAMLAFIHRDIRTSLRFDFRWKSYKFCEEHAYHHRLSAYNRHRWYDNSMCLICMGEYKDDDEERQRQLLFCGHLYHKSCLEEYEYYKWNNNNGRNWPYPICKCPYCSVQYHGHFEKYDYDKNFKYPLWFRGFNYPGLSIIKELIWNRTALKHRHHSQKEWNAYPYRWSTNYCCSVCYS